MADPGDDLLEDGDLGDGHFDLDLAEEDALLADDYDDKPIKPVRGPAEISRNHPNVEDEDFIEIGVDEDLAITDEAKTEAENKGTRRNIVFDDSNNDDSDDGGKERTRFKTERNINAVPRPTAVIPETLDAVAVKTQPNMGFNQRGGPRGGGGGGMMMKRGGFRGIGGMRGGFHPRGIGGGFFGPHPRFRPPNPMLHHHHHHHPHQPPMPMPPVYMQHPPHNKQQHMEVVAQTHQYPPPPPPPHHFPPQHQMVDQFNTPPEECYQQHPPPTPPISQPTFHPPPVAQPPATNIHVNPHFRGPRPQVTHNLAMWNGTSNYVPANHNVQQQNYQQPPTQQSSYQNNYQANQSNQWNENTNVNDYYPNQNASVSSNNYGQDDQYYNGASPNVDHYYQHQQGGQSNYQPVSGGASGSNNVGPNTAAQQQMNWNDNYYNSHQGPPTTSQPHQNNYNQMNPSMNHNQLMNRPHHQQLQLKHKKVFPPNKKMILPYNKVNKFQVVTKGRGAKIIHTMKKEVILPNKLSPTKPVRVETGALRKIQITNLQEVPVTTNEVPKANIPEPEEEDEEMKAYRKKIEEQKKLREQVLKQKEEKRKVAAQQKFQLLAAKKKIAEEQAAAAVTNSTSTNAANQQFKIVRVRLQDGRTVVKKLSTAQISKLKKISSGTTKPAAPQLKSETPQPKSRIVVVDNLSASTTQKQLENMAKQMGKVERVQLNPETKRATVVFENTSSAVAFIQKFQRKMVDLSMISLRMVINEDGDCSGNNTNVASSSSSTSSTITTTTISTNGGGNTATTISTPSTTTTTTTTTNNSNINNKTIVKPMATSSSSSLLQQQQHNLTLKPKLTKPPLIKPMNI